MASTARPMSPPNTMFPQTQPLTIRSKVRVDVSYPAREMLTMCSFSRESSANNGVLPSA